MTSRHLKWATTLWLSYMGIEPPCMIEMATGITAILKAKNLTYGQLFDVFMSVADKGTHEDLQFGEYYQPEELVPLHIHQLREGLIRIDFMSPIKARSKSGSWLDEGEYLRLNVEDITLEFKVLSRFSMRSELIEFLRPYVIGNVPFMFAAYLKQKGYIESIDPRTIHTYTINPEQDLRANI
jgi:hypothetical protein